jgi:hypothetical protein
MWMVVVPVDAQIDEAEHIAQKHRRQGAEGGEGRAMGHFQFQHHDGDQDGDHPVAEGFQPALAHRSLHGLTAKDGAACDNGRACFVSGRG